MVDRCAFFKMLVKSRADSTAKKYLFEIRRFLASGKQNSVAKSYPFSSTVVTLYLFQLFTNQHNSFSVLVMEQGALKWFHSFVPIVELAAIARGIRTLNYFKSNTDTVVLISFVFRVCFNLHQLLFLPLVLTATNY